MLTAFPYYPWWKKQPEAAGRMYSRQRHGKVNVVRCWHYVPARPSTVKRLLHELSFVFFSFWAALFQGVTGRGPDVFVAVSPPLFSGLAVFTIGALFRRPVLLHVQDLQPDAAAGLGMLKMGFALKWLYRLEKWNYNRASVVSGISQGMLDAYTRKNVTGSKQYYFPNWIPDEALPAGAASASFRASHGIDPRTPLIAYSGNVGVKQGLEAVVEAAARSPAGGSARTIHWAICGEGAAKPALEAMIRRSSVKEGVRLYPLQPDDLYHALLREADVSLIAQQRGTGQFFFPSKLLSILQYGRPVLAVADDSSELARAVRVGGFGLVVEPGDSAALLAAAEAMVSASDEQKAAWGRNGKTWVDQFRRSRVLGDFERKLIELTARKY